MGGVLSSTVVITVVMAVLSGLSPTTTALLSLDYCEVSKTQYEVVHSLYDVIMVTSLTNGEQFHAFDAFCPPQSV